MVSLFLSHGLLLPTVLCVSTLCSALALLWYICVAMLLLSCEACCLLVYLVAVCDLRALVIMSCVAVALSSCCILALAIAYVMRLFGALFLLLWPLRIVCVRFRSWVMPRCKGH